MVIQGMNYAVGSGIRAAETVLDAKERGDFSSKTMQEYKRRLQQSYIWKDFQRFSDMEEVVWNQRIHHLYPEFVEGVFTEMFTQDETPKEKTRDVVRNQMKEKGVSPLTMIKDALNAGKNL
jgi:electron transfer flavoprotein-quinone oxidoreductase